MAGSKIVSSGSFLPPRFILNDDLPKHLETSDEWISERTGIRKRHIADDGMFTSDLAVEAVKCALSKNGLEPSSLDGIIVATCTPDLIFPSTASIVSKKLGMNSGFAFDCNAACSGFIYALAVADSMLKNKLAKRIALIGAETMTRIVDWEDRATCVLFGDGAGAFILEANENSDSGILCTSVDGDSQLAEILYVEGGADSAKVKMKGKDVYKQAVEKMFSSLKKICEQNKISFDEIDWFIPHQANQRILSAVSEKLGVNSSKFISTVAEHANTSSASIPLAFDESVAMGKIKKGDTIALTAFGAGLSWGSCIFKY